MFEVVGGHHTNFEFTHVMPGREERYGPFPTRQEAYDVWKLKTWQNVDDGQHRLTIVDLDPELEETGYFYPYPGVSATATVVLVQRGFGEGAIHRYLLGQRTDDADAFPGKWCLPGGFLNPATKGKSGIFARILKGVIQLMSQNKLKGETLEDTAIREVKEETNVDLRKEQLKLFYVHSNPDTDPRAHVVNVCYYAILEPDQLKQVKAGDDLQDVDWFHEFEVNAQHLAFNHNELFEKFEENFRED